MHPPLGPSTLRPGFRAQKAATNLGPCAPYPTVRYRARGPRFWAGNWAQNPVLKIRPSGGPAGWDKVCAPGVIRTPCQAKARVTVGMVSHAQARLVQCVVLCPSQMVRSLCKRAPFSSPNVATEAMTPPFCIISFRLHGFCTPCGQLWAETFEFLEFNGNFAKHRKCGVRCSGPF